MSNSDNTSPMSLIIREDFGKNLQSLREQAGFSQGDLALKLNALCHSDYSRTNISKWERGTAFPPVNLLPILSVALQVPLGAFFHFSDGDSKPTKGEDQESERGKMKYFKEEFKKDPNAAFQVLYGLMDDTLTKLEDMQEKYKLLEEKQKIAVKIMNS